MAVRLHGGIEVWTDDTGVQEVGLYASEATEHALILYLGAYRRRDVAAMQECAKQLRHVATRLDQFTRLKLKQWNSPARDTSHPEKIAT